MVKISKSITALLLFFGIILFLELSSSLILNNVISPSRLERFDALFHSDSQSLKYFVPHPSFGWVHDETLTEIDRYLSYVGEDRTNRVYVAALGGSTTFSGHPAYTETYLNERLKESGSPLEAVVFNFGVSDWNSLRSVQFYFHTLKSLHPDFVVVHHNFNDHRLPSESDADLLIYPEILPVERQMVQVSRFYKLLRFTYLLGYNPLRYGRHITQDEHVVQDYPMASRISSYLGEETPQHSTAAHYFMSHSGNRTSSTTPPEGRQFALRENYGNLIQNAKENNTTVVLTTQYANYSRIVLPSDESRVIERAVSDEINDFIRELSLTYKVPLVDLAEEMEDYDSLLIDGLHFKEEGIQLKGELLGEAIFKILKNQYNLTE